MIYQIIFINGRAIEFTADEFEFEDGVYRFLIDGEVIAEFVRNNIAGFYSLEETDEEDQDI